MTAFFIGEIKCTATNHKAVVKKYPRGKNRFIFIYVKGLDREVFAVCHSCINFGKKVNQLPTGEALHKVMRKRLK